MTAESVGLMFLCLLVGFIGAAIFGTNAEYTTYARKKWWTRIAWAWLGVFAGPPLVKLWIAMVLS